MLLRADLLCWANLSYCSFSPWWGGIERRCPSSAPHHSENSLIFRTPLDTLAVLNENGFTVWAHCPCWSTMRRNIVNDYMFHIVRFFHQTTVRWCSWLSRQSNTLKVGSSSLPWIKAAVVSFLFALCLPSPESEGGVVVDRSDLRRVGKFARWRESYATTRTSKHEAHFRLSLLFGLFAITVWTHGRCRVHAFYIFSTRLCDGPTDLNAAQK
jgi:hypothetical protein